MLEGYKFGESHVVATNYIQAKRQAELIWNMVEEYSLRHMSPNTILVDYGIEIKPRKYRSIDDEWQVDRA